MSKKRRQYSGDFKAKVALAALKGDETTSELAARFEQVVWVGEGRSGEAIRPFFEWLGDAREQMEAVARDMNSVVDLEVKAQCPNVAVVYDRFPVVAKSGREVMDRVHRPVPGQSLRPWHGFGSVPG